MSDAPRDVADWPPPVPRHHVLGVPADVPFPVEGKRLVGPAQGFGRMWQKTYRVSLAGASVSPAELIATWKERFPSFWPEGNEFHTPLTGLELGEIAHIRASGPSGLELSTGVMVLYVDDEGFTLMTPEGHLFAGWITFGAHDQAGTTIAQVQLLYRAQDPLTELGLALGGHRMENRFWQQTLARLAAHFGVGGEVETTVICVDKRRQWSRAGNIRHLAAIRSLLHMLRSRKTPASG